MSPANDNARLVSLNQVSALTSLSRTAINKHRAAGRFPCAVSLGDRRVAFVRSEVDAWIDARIAARAASRFPKIDLLLGVPPSAFLRPKKEIP